MMGKDSIFVFLVVLTAKCSYSSEFTYSNSLDFDGKVEFQWKFDKNTITFQITAPTRGWIGVGFSPSGSMKGADIMFGWIGDGHPHILDMHATTNGLPALDTEQNILSSNIRENDTHTIMHIRRWLDTCDEAHDFKITDDTTRVIFAFGESDPEGDVPTFSEHHGTDNRGVKSLRLLDKKLPSLSHEAMRTENIKSHDIVTAPFRIPKKDTYYHCFYHKLPDMDKKHHIIEFQPILDAGNVRNIHHITLSHCKDWLVTDDMLKRSEECYTNDEGDHWKYCAPVIVSWSVGMTSFTLPKHVGFPIGISGTAKVVRMEIHYDNVDLVEGKMDESGLRILYTDKLRQYDAGTLLTGHDVWPSLFIPPGSKDFVVEGHCSAQCLSKVMLNSGVSSFKAFGVFLHSHTAGSGMVLRHFRNGTELTPIAKDLAYDFDYQESKLLSDEIVIQTGDNLIMECLYNTQKRRMPTIGGLATRDEMCFGFIMYYPKIEDAYCQSSPKISNTYAALKATNIREAFINAMTSNWTDKERAEFNKVQLSGPVYELCITLKGKVKGLKSLYKLPKITAEFVEEPGRCALVKKSSDASITDFNTTFSEGSHTRILIQKSKDGTKVIVIAVSTLSVAAIFLMLALLYHKMK